MLLSTNFCVFHLVILCTTRGRAIIVAVQIEQTKGHPIIARHVIVSTVHLINNITALLCETNCCHLVVILCQILAHQVVQHLTGIMWR